MSESPAQPNAIKRVQVIVNPAAGQPGDAILNELHRVFTVEAGIKWDLALTHEAGDAVRLAEAALEDAPDALVVYGGDGTVREVASVLKCTDVPLAILPGGTGNLFAVHQRIPRALRRAARLITGPHRVAQVDVGLANGETFVVAAALGLIAEAMAITDRDMKQRMGYPAYLVSGYRKLRELTYADYRFSLDGEQRGEEQGIACLVSNTNSVGITGLSVPAGGSNEDGVLDVLFFHDVDPQTVVSVVGDILGLQELTAPLVRWPVRRAHIEADPPQLVNLDGDEAGTTPLDIEILPGALKVITQV